MNEVQSRPIRIEKEAITQSFSVHTAHVNRLYNFKSYISISNEIAPIPMGLNSQHFETNKRHLEYWLVLLINYIDSIKPITTAQEYKLSYTIDVNIFNVTFSIDK